MAAALLALAAGTLLGDLGKWDDPLPPVTSALRRDLPEPQPIQEPPDRPGTVAGVSGVVSARAAGVVVPAGRLAALVHWLPGPHGWLDRVRTRAEDTNRVLVLAAVDRAWDATDVFRIERPFSSRMGQLPAPVGGPLSVPFGPILSEDGINTLRNPGIVIRAGGGSLVGAVAPGYVVFSGPVGGYGHVVILDHGRGYTTTYGRVGEALVARGEIVRTRQPLGSLGADATGLYFELRRFVDPLNPEPWWAPAETAAR